MGKILDSTKITVNKIEFSLFITKVMGKFIFTMVRTNVHFPAFVKDFMTYEEASAYYTKQVEKLAVNLVTKK